MQFTFLRPLKLVRRYCYVLVERLHRRASESGFGNQESIKVGPSTQIGSFTTGIEVTESQDSGTSPRNQE